jgi:glutamate carboxypeptidase
MATESSSLNTWANTLTQTLSTHKKTMLHQLDMLCSIHSGSHQLQGLAQIHEALKQLFSPLVDEIETHALPPIPGIDLAGQHTHTPVGALLYLRKRPHLKRRVLLSGHMDTVFGDYDHDNKLIKSTKDRLKGPGVSDMRGGLLVMLHALQAFEETPFTKTLGWDVVITADEELGSPGSRAFLESIRTRYLAALVYEPAVTPEGEFAKNRKGSGKFTLIATGKTAHAGRAFNKGRNAIPYLAEALVSINALNKNDRKITFNIGEIAGGKALNIVPDTAVAKLDVRISLPEDEAWVIDAFNTVIKQLKRDGYHLKLHGEFGRPVKRINPESEALFKRLQHLGAMQGLSFDWQDTGGCCDGNNLMHPGIAILDTLGVRGGGIHGSKEFLIIDSLVERASLSALLLVDLARGGLEELTK